MAKKKKASSKKLTPEVKSAELIKILALKRPARPPAVGQPVVNENIAAAGNAPDQESFISPESATETNVITKLPEDVKLNSLNDNLPNVDLVTKSNDDPPIGTKIKVTAPWGTKVMVEVNGCCTGLDGAKWVSFDAVNAIPDGWFWEGGVKLIS